MKRFAVLVDGQQAVTNDAGVFLIALNSSVTHVKIDMESNQYSVLYPSAGHLFIPKDPNAIQEIIVGNPGDNSLLKEYAKLVESNSNQKDANIKNFLNLKIDSLRKQLLELNYTQNDLEESRRLLEARQESRSKILTALTDFTNDAEDLSIAFGSGSKYSFDSKEALVDLQVKITTYTKSWSELSNERFNYQKFVEQYWGSDTISKDFSNHISFALDTLHRNILEMNDSKDKILAYRNSQKKDKNFKNEIQLEIDARLLKINNELAEMKRRNEALRRELN